MPIDTQPFLDWYTARRLRSTGRSPSPNTLRTKRLRLNQAATIVGATGLESLGTILSSRQGLERVLDAIAARMTPGAQRIIVDALGDFSKYCEAQGWPSLPLTRLDVPAKNPPKAIVVYTEDELHTLLIHARVVGGFRWELFLETLIGTGRRISEVLDLEYAWLNLAADPPHFHLPTSKNGNQQYVPLKTTLAALWASDAAKELPLADQGRWVKDVARYPFPWTYPVANRNFNRYCKRVGVESRGFHCFRHTMATDMMARGVPIQAVSALLGHSSVATTDRVYNHTTALTHAHYLG